MDVFPGGPIWRRSTWCADSTCAEVAVVGDRIAVRNSTHPEVGPVLLTIPEWDALVRGIKAGEFDDFAVSD